MDPRSLTRINDYEVVRFIAEGGMSWVFEVSDPRAAGARRALKLLKPEITGSLRERFFEEARKLVTIQHPNLVTVHHVDEDPAIGCLFYTMQYVAGGTLSNRLVKRGQMSLDAAAPIIDGVLAALCKLHESGIAHLDVKPANVLLDEHDWPLVSDLGISRDQGLNRTVTGKVIGTVRYMSPEQGLGIGCDMRSDVFSAGLTIHRTLVGRSIYDIEIDAAIGRGEVENPDATLVGASGNSQSVSEMSVLGFLTSQCYAKREFEFEFPPEAGVPPAAQEVVRRACRMDPTERYATACEMRGAWQAAIAQRSAPVPTLTWEDSEPAGDGRGDARRAGRPPARRGPRIAAWVGGGVSALLLAAALFTFAPELASLWPGEVRPGQDLASPGGDASALPALRSEARARRVRLEALLASAEQLDPQPGELTNWRERFVETQALHDGAHSARELTAATDGYDELCRDLDLDIERRIARVDVRLRSSLEAVGDAARLARLDELSVAPRGAPCEAAASNGARLADVEALRDEWSGGDPRRTSLVAVDPPRPATVDRSDASTEPESVDEDGAAELSDSPAPTEVAALASPTAPSATASAARSAADKARTQAEEAMADFNAPLLWDEAQTLMAERRYSKARKVFEEAALIAGDALLSAQDQDASMRKERARIGVVPGCAGVRPEAALGACREAEALRRQIDDALGRMDARAALIALSEEEFALHTYESARYIAPELVSQSPAGPSILAERGVETLASVVVRDSDPLTYRWSFEGETVGGNGNKLYFKPQSAGRLVVEADDGFGGAVRVEWNVELKALAGESPPADR